MKLEVFGNFFTRFFILDHNAPNLDPDDRNKALAYSILFGILSLGIVHGVCALCKWCIKPADMEEDKVQNVDQIRQQNLGINQNDPAQVVPAQNVTPQASPQKVAQKKDERKDVPPPPEMTAEEKELVRAINQDQAALSRAFDSWDEAKSFLERNGNNLTYLDLSDFKDHNINNADCEQITLLCRKLQHIGIHSTEITDDALACFKQMNDLTHVDFSWCENLTDDGLKHLKGKKLTHVDLHGCENLTDDGLKHLEGMPLTYVDFSSCSNLTDKGLKYLDKMKNLTHVNFSSCNKLTDKGIEHLQEMINLTHVNFSSCTNLTDKGLKYLEKMKNLTHLDLGDCENLTDEGLGYFKGMPLEYVKLSYCNKLTDKGVEHLKGMPLTEIDLRGCIKLTDKSLEHLEGMKDLTTAYFSGCENMTDEGFFKLKENIPLIKSDMLPEED